MAVVVRAQDLLEVLNAVLAGCLDGEGAPGHRFSAGDLPPGQVGTPHIRGDFVAASLIGLGKVKVGIVTFLGGLVPAVFQVVRSRVLEK